MGCQLLFIRNDRQGALNAISQTWNLAAAVNDVDRSWNPQIPRTQEIPEKTRQGHNIRNQQVLGSSSSAGSKPHNNLRRSDDPPVSTRGGPVSSQLPRRP